MDVEDPDAARIISLADNKKHEAGMAAGHPEIFKALVSLCVPSPGVELHVPYEPVWDKMVDWYQAAVDHKNFKDAFQVVLDAGGHTSPHMKDLQLWIELTVNPTIRKFRWESYGAVANYGIHFPRLKNAMLKWAWKQPPNNCMCQVPPKIDYRFNEKHEYSMRELMLEIEGALAWNSRAFEVMMKDLGERTKKISELEIDVASKIIAVPKKDEKKTLEQQEAALRSDCAGLIAKKIIQTAPDVHEEADLPVTISASTVNSLLHEMQNLYKDKIL